MRASFIGLVGFAIGTAGCTSGTLGGDDTPELPDAKAYVQTLPDGPCAKENVTGTIPGVTISLHSDSCVYRPGAVATFTYEVSVDATAPTIVVPAEGTGGGCGICDNYSTDPLSFLRATIGGDSPVGDSQFFCPGAGCCPQDPERAFDLTRGTFTKTFQWSGRTLECADDTPVYEGQYFPSGVYDVNLGFSGFAAGDVATKLPVEMLDP